MLSPDQQALVRGFRASGGLTETQKGVLGIEVCDSRLRGLVATVADGMLPSGDEIEEVLKALGGSRGGTVVDPIAALLGAAGAAR